MPQQDAQPTQILTLNKTHINALGYAIWNTINNYCQDHDIRLIEIGHAMLQVIYNTGVNDALNNVLTVDQPNTKLDIIVKPNEA
jgi:hypothetical protein